MIDGALNLGPALAHPVGVLEVMGGGDEALVIFTQRDGVVVVILADLAVELPDRLDCFVRQEALFGAECAGGGLMFVEELAGDALVSLFRGIHRQRQGDEEGFFVTIVELEPNLDDWCAWAYAADLPSEIVVFIRFRPELLCKFEATRELTNSPSPRTVAAVGRWVRDGVTDLEVLPARQGRGSPPNSLASSKSHKPSPSIDAILLDPMGAPVPKEASALCAVTAALVRRFTKANAARVFTYAARLPKEFEVCLVRDGRRVNKDLTTTREFTEWAVKNAGVLG
jgi:hypothetical protein